MRKSPPLAPGISNGIAATLSAARRIPILRHGPELHSLYSTGGQRPERDRGC